MTDEKPTDGATSNIGYAAVPDGFVFIPATTGDPDVLQKLFAAVDDPEHVITRPGYGYVVPAAAATASGLTTAAPVVVVDPATPDTSVAKSALDTVDAPVADNVGDTADGLPPVDTTADTTSTTTKSSKTSSAAPAAG